MIVVFLRATVLYFVVLFSLRIMGKGELGELQPHDLVISLMIAELAAMPMEDLNSPISHGVTAIVTLMFLQCFISYISLKSNYIRKFLCGRPCIILEHGKFNVKEMNRLRININDVLGQLRLKGYNSIDGVDYLIIETNGQMSVLASQDNQNTKCERIPITVVLDGCIMHDNINKYNLSVDKLYKEIEKENIELKNILYGFVDEQNKYIFYKKAEKGKE